MRLQFQILLYIVCLNLTTGMVIALGLPGTEYVQAQNPSNATQYEEHFNATDLAQRWRSQGDWGIPIVGDIFSAFELLIRNIQYLLDGFPMFLQWISDTYIADANARTSFFIISNVLRAIFAILMSMLLIEFISGRYFTH